MELTNERDKILWHVKMGECFPEDGSVNGVVRFGKTDKTYIQHNVFYLHQPLLPTNHKHYIGGRTVRSEITLFLRKDSHALAMLTEATRDDVQLHFPGVRYQQDSPPVVVAICPTFLFVEYHDGGTSPSPPPNTNDNIEQSPSPGEIVVEGNFGELNGDPVLAYSLSIP